MKFYNVTLTEGTHITNMIVPISASAPSSPNGGEVYFNSTDYTLYIYDGGAATWNKIAVLSGNGNLVLGSSEVSGAGKVQLNNAGIMFPSTPVASSDPNTLDDYEEGSWTPVFYLGGSSVGFTYSSQVGRFVKIGSQVFVSGYTAYTAKGSGTGQFEIGGLPFTPNASNVGIASGGNLIGASNTSHPNTYAAITSNSRIGFYKQGSSTVTALADTDIHATSTGYYFICNYTV